MKPERESRSRDGFRLILLARVSAAAMLSLLLGVLLAFTEALHARSQANSLASWNVAIVLPPRIMAGHPATLAVLGVDGKLASGVKVDLSDGQSVTTDSTGRALFSAPPTGEYLLARGSGASAAALVDPAAGSSEPVATTLAPLIATHDSFWICGGQLSGDADANTVKINDQPALVIAASPICLIALPGPAAKPGPAFVSIEAPGVKSSATTALVSLEFDAPKLALKPRAKGQLIVRAEGTTQPLRIVVQDRTPGILEFASGESQAVATSGGPENTAAIRVQAIASGDYSFSARLLPPPDSERAQRFLRAAENVAPPELRRKVSDLAGRLARHPQETERVRRELDRVISAESAGDLRILLDAARAAL